MLAVWLIRTFPVLRNIWQGPPAPTAPSACRPGLPRLARQYTGLGMAPFPINSRRSTAGSARNQLARVRAIDHADERAILTFRKLARRAARNADEWQVADERQAARIKRLRLDFEWIVARADALDASDARPGTRSIAMPRTACRWKGRRRLSR